MQKRKQKQKSKDPKFILGIPHKMQYYLEWASDTKRLHKSQIVREAIERAISKDEDYKRHKELLTRA